MRWQGDEWGRETVVPGVAGETLVHLPAITLQARCTPPRGGTAVYKGAAWTKGIYRQAAVAAGMFPGCGVPLAGKGSCVGEGGVWDRAVAGGMNGEGTVVPGVPDETLVHLPAITLQARCTPSSRRNSCLQRRCMDE